jgi:hypothetical protein
MKCIRQERERPCKEAEKSFDEKKEDIYDNAGPALQRTVLTAHSLIMNVVIIGDGFLKYKMNEPFHFPFP